ncbi:MAG: hypothetical protein KF716_29665 [Anaerolineae bacterium]|nr:hypothetical protein [Anaerolineae bacterium]
MLEILRHPEDYLVLVFVLAPLANLLFVAREAAVQFSLRQKGLVGEAMILQKRRVRGRNGTSYHILYQFYDPNSERYFQHAESVSRQHFLRWNVDDVVRIVMLSDNPHVSRLVDDVTHPYAFFVVAIISPIFPIYFFGWGSLPIVFLIFAIGFTSFLLWINLRPI